MRRTLITLGVLTAGVAVAFVAFDGKRHIAHAAAGHGSERVERWCNDDSKDWADKATKRVNKELDLTSDQSAAWQKVEAELRAGSDAVKSACRDELAKGLEETAPARLAFMERMMEVGLEEFKGAREEFDTFYGTLDAEQKAEVDEHLGHRHHRRHHKNKEQEG